MVKKNFIMLGQRDKKIKKMSKQYDVNEFVDNALNYKEFKVSLFDVFNKDKLKQKIKNDIVNYIEETIYLDD
jgi:hypothetical protein